MNFRTLIPNGAIVADLISTTKKESIAEMVDAMITSGAISEDIRAGVLTALLKREELSSTGINDGLAIPHAKHPGIKKLTALFARSREGVEFKAIDEKPSHIFFLLLSNQETAAQHLESLAYISTQFNDGGQFGQFLLKARDEKEIRALLNDADDTVLSGG